ncbi:MAG: hypothetical protein N3I35_09975 [Clostridia bacterium]|nr:hypothetical protein [Clostridia bacterium]
MSDSSKLNELLVSIINIIIIPLLPVISAYLIALVKSKIAEIGERTNGKELSMYADIAENAVITAVTAVNQVYVDELKRKNGKLTAYEQKVAFEMAKEKVLNILGDTTLKVLGTLYKDFDAWLDSRIEYYVNQSKAKADVLGNKSITETI